MSSNVRFTDLITEIQITIPDPKRDDRVRGYLSIKFNDAYILRDLKIIEKNENDGSTKLLLSMPSRDNYVHCVDATCGKRTPAKGRFCMYCRCELPRAARRDDGGEAHYYEVFNPLYSEARKLLEELLFQAFLTHYHSGQWEFGKPKDLHRTRDGFKAA